MAALLTAKFPLVPDATAPMGQVCHRNTPRLSGQHADYTTAQLSGFRDGVRQNNLIMTQVAAKLNDREIKAVSDYIAGLR